MVQFVVVAWLTQSANIKIAESQLSPEYLAAPWYFVG